MGGNLVLVIYVCMFIHVYITMYMSALLLFMGTPDESRAQSRFYRYIAVPAVLCFVECIKMNIECFIYKC